MGTSLFALTKDRISDVTLPKLLATDRLEAVDLARTLAVQRTPQVPVLLQPKPEVSRHSDHPRQPQGRIRRHPTLPPDDLIQTRKGDREARRQSRLGNPERDEELLEQHLPWMRRSPRGAH